LFATILQHLCEHGFTIYLLKCERAIKKQLARLLSYTAILKALEKENRCHTTYETSSQCHRTAYVNWLRKLMSWHVAKSCTYPKTINRSIWVEKRRLLLTDEMQKAFNKMRLLMAANALAAYLDCNKRFNVYTDASDFQLGACIIQGGRPVAYFSQKLATSQQNYTTMEKEMLSIVTTLEEKEQTFMFLWIIQT
jgi:hypothetical protein